MPGSRTPVSSVTPEGAAASAACNAGKSGKLIVAAIVAAGAAGGALLSLAWLMNYINTSLHGPPAPPPSCTPPDPRCTPGPGKPGVVTTAPGIDTSTDAAWIEDVAQSFVARDPRKVLTIDQARIEARECRFLVDFARSTGQVALPADPCRTMPIFLPGSDAGSWEEEVAAIGRGQARYTYETPVVHDYAALTSVPYPAGDRPARSNPAWFVLNYTANPVTRAKWYYSAKWASPCYVRANKALAGTTDYINAQFRQCDEMPFRSTTQMTPATASTRLTNGDQNVREGAILGLLPTTCFKKQLAVNPNATPAYLVIPMPFAEAPPTTVICQPNW